MMIPAWRTVVVAGCALIVALTPGWGRIEVHPILMMTASQVAEMRHGQAEAPLFAKAIEDATVEVKSAMALGVRVPVPKDMAGGYSHEVHKQNFFILQKAGVLYQVTGQVEYAEYVKEVLMAYIAMYPSIDRHPSTKSYAPGRFFWQCLNDANWLVYVSQAYDCIHDWLSEADRNKIENELLRPHAEFLSVENPQFFNRIHNHSTWGIAAVGLTALVLQDGHMLDHALNGLEMFDDLSGTDNDGGAIREDNHGEAGFYAQMDFAFSPDGYYTEGPYYHRYAMSPFILLATALYNTGADSEIFRYKNDVLVKAVSALLYQTDPQGQFFPINDAQKGMSVGAREVVAAVAAAYTYGADADHMLGAVLLQKKVDLSYAGYNLAKAFEDHDGSAFMMSSVELRDGSLGKSGAIGVLRIHGKFGEVCLAMKYAGQGMGHGHFDRLSYSLYDDLGEVIQDYGAVRWVNIDQKGGGRYLPENKTWAKQTVAHNTAVINGVSHFEANYQESADRHAIPYFFAIEDPRQQFVSASDTNAYPGVELHRTLGLCLGDDDTPFVVDVMVVRAPRSVQVDLPLWHVGHVLQTQPAYVKQNYPAVMGSHYGYQHLYREGMVAPAESAQFTWMNGRRFYTTTLGTSSGDTVLFARLGANDPENNLRPDPVCIWRSGGEALVLASVTELHGAYDPSDEIPLRPYSHISSVQASMIEDKVVVEFGSDDRESYRLVLALDNPALKQMHTIDYTGQQISWTGPYTFSNTQVN